MNKVTVVAVAFAISAAAFSFTAPVQAGTCQPVKAKGFADTLAKATLYAQADLKQTAKSMKGKVTQATTRAPAEADAPVLLDGSGFAAGRQFADLRVDLDDGRAQMRQAADRRYRRGCPLGERG